MSHKHDKKSNNPFKNDELDEQINESSVEETAEEIKDYDKKYRYFVVLLSKLRKEIKILKTAKQQLLQKYF